MALDFRVPLRLAVAVAIGAFIAPLAAIEPEPVLADELPANVEAVCPAALPGTAECLALRRTDVALPAGTQLTPQPQSTSGPYAPSDLRTAYALPTGSQGAGLTVAVVDAYDLPTAESDLATYRSWSGLPACTTANGCFHKVDQNGGTNYPAANAGWGQEIALDLDMVSATCPHCNILLVEATNNNYSNLGPAVNRAVAMGAVAVSNSYGGQEWAGETAYDHYYNHPGVAITVSTGDCGYNCSGNYGGTTYNSVEWPAASQYVVAVGGTSLTPSGNARGWAELAWGDVDGGAGSGCSVYEPKPSWQHDASCAHRMSADVSAVADPETGVYVYQQGWMVFGGTSASSPIIAAMYALAGGVAVGTYPASTLYADPTGLNDAIGGNNDVTEHTCTVTYFCNGVTGYDGPTGIGTPNGVSAFTTGTDDWPQFHYGPAHQGYNPAETTISAANAANLGLDWKGTTGYGIDAASPVVSNGVVYITSPDGNLYAFAVGCANRGSSCAPIWTADTGAEPITSAAVADGVVYVTAYGQPSLQAFDVNCSSGGATCTPVWTANPGDIETDPVVANGMVYVTTVAGGLFAYSEGCASGGGICTPVWSANNLGTPGNALTTAPTVADGVVYVEAEATNSPATGMLYAFDVNCSSHGGICTPLWTAATSFPWGAAPVVASGLVYVGTNDGHVSAYAVGCASGGGTCSPLWFAATGGVISSTPAIAGGVMYVAAAGNSVARLYAYADHCGVGGATCAPIWSAVIGTGPSASSPAVANGVVYVGSNDGNLYAFAVGCATAGGTCAPLWTGATGGLVFSSPSVVGGVVYVASMDASLYAFGFDHGPLDHLVLTPATANIVAGASVAYRAEGYDALGNAWDVTSLTTLAVAGGSCDNVAHTCSSGIVGDHQVTGTSGIATGTSTIRVAAGGLDHLVLSPANATVAAGNPQAYSAHAADSFGNDLGIVTDSTAFTIDSGLPCAGHSCGSSVLGDHAVTGTYGSATGGATLHVTAGAANALLITGPATASAGLGQTYTVRAVDSYGHTASGYAGSVIISSSDPAMTWSVVSAMTSGVGTFSVVLHSVGVQTVGAYDPSLIATSMMVEVTEYVGPIPATYHPTAPTRLLDTRHNNGWGLALVTNTPVTFQITGRDPVPAGATAVTGNLTVTGSSFSWAVYLGPDPVVSPTSSTINFGPGETTANGLTVALSSTGSLSATYMSTPGNTTDLVFDVTGFFTPDGSGATYHTMTPARLLDTRVGNGLPGKLLSNTPVCFAISAAGRPGSPVPAAATAVSGNVTVVNETFSWAVYVGPDPVASPAASTLNFNTGDVKANNLTVALGTAGRLCLTYMSIPGQTTDLVFDVTGFYTADASGARYVPLTPARVLDTRVGNGLPGKIVANTPVSVTVAGRRGVPAEAVAVSGNVTVVNETFSWAVYAGPLGIANPTTSTLNFNAGDVKANGLTVALGSGLLWFTYMSTPANNTDLVFDVTGYFVP